MNTILAVVLALVPSVHAAVFPNETTNRNTSEVHLRQNSFGGGHGGSFFYPGSPGYAKWSRGRNEDDKGSGLPHGHQHTVRPPPGGLECDFCTPATTTPGPGIPMSERIKQSRLAWARVENRKTTWPPEYGLATPRPKCYDHSSAKYCAQVKDVEGRCAEDDYPVICAKTCGFCKESPNDRGPGELPLMQQP